MTWVKISKAVAFKETGKSKQIKPYSVTVFINTSEMAAIRYNPNGLNWDADRHVTRLATVHVTYPGGGGEIMTFTDKKDAEEAMSLILGALEQTSNSLTSRVVKKLGERVKKTHGLTEEEIDSITDQVFDQEIKSRKK